MGNLAYNEDEKYELLDGKIFYMSPRPAVKHNMVIGTIYRIFGNFLKGKTCTPFVDGVDVYLTENNRVIPDVMIVCNRDIIKKDGIYGTPDLIVEVLSPSTAKNDKGYKKSLYEKCGVREYWIVDIENRSIEIYVIEDNRYVLHNMYSIYPDYVVAKMTDEEKSTIVMEFSSTLFPEMILSLYDIFDNDLF